MFYRDLDRIKAAYYGNDAFKPQVAGDFQICTVEDERALVDFEQLHDELNAMLKDVKAALTESGIYFYA